MGFNLSKDWPAYLLLSFAAFFFIYVIVKGNLDARKDKKDQNKEKEKTEEKR
jgi:preprotein translocase subunit SecG